VRTWGTLLGAALVSLLVAPPAWAAPAATLCETDVSRGAVPEVFVVDACVDAAGVTLRNTADAPVVVEHTGDLGAPLWVSRAGGDAATLTRLTGSPDDVLMPGDIVRWPVGVDAATVTVTGLDPTMVPAVVESLSAVLPGPATDEAQAGTFQRFAGLVRSVASAVETRASCLEGKNFLRVAACDAAAAGAIGHAVSSHVRRSDADDVVAVVLDPERWDEWSAVRPAVVGPAAERTLRLAAAPGPPPVPSPVVAPRPAPPAVAPAPVPVAAPAPLPGPAPAPQPPQVLPTLPSAPGWPSWEAPFDRNADAGKGKGNGHGNGKGNGRGKGKGGRDD
jgi:hypothetical protein